MNKSSLTAAVIVSMMLIVPLTPFIIVDDGGEDVRANIYGLSSESSVDFEAEGYIPISTPYDLARVGTGVIGPSDAGPSGPDYEWALDANYYLLNDIEFEYDDGSGNIVYVDTNDGMDLSVSITVASGSSGLAKTDIKVSAGGAGAVNSVYAWIGTGYAANDRSRSVYDTASVDHVPWGENVLILGGTVTPTGGSAIGFAFSVPVTINNGTSSLGTFNSNGNFTPIGAGPSFPDSFNGIFDGNGKKITGMEAAVFQDSRNAGAYAGLFASIGTDAQIRYLTIEESSVVAATGSYYGDFIDATSGGISAAVFEASIRNCSFAGSVVAASYRTVSNAGGMTGVLGNGGTITKCSNAGNVIASTIAEGNAGGIAGSIGSAVITDCYNEGEITAATAGQPNTSKGPSAGGISGYADPGTGTSYSGTIADCINDGPVVSVTRETADSSAGGILGVANLRAPMVISGCVNNGSVDSENLHTFGSPSAAAGGIAGIINTLNVLAEADVLDCSNIGDIHSKTDEKQHAGGILGTASATNGRITVFNCHNEGDVFVEVPSTGAATATAGGIAGYAVSYSSITISECYNIGNIIGTFKWGPEIGGILGRALTFLSGQVMISDCYNIGIIDESCTESSGSPCVGGILGYAYAEPGGSLIRLTNCYNAGSIETTSNYPDITGGIVGGYRMYVQSGSVTGSVEIINCYFLEEQMWDSKKGIFYEDLIYGGDHYNSGTMPSPAVDGNSVPERTSNPDQSSGAKNVTEMQPDLTDAQNGDSIYYTGTTTTVKGTEIAGWDFTDIWIIDEEMNDGYPLLRSSLENAQTPLITDQYVSGWILRNASAELFVTASVTDGGTLTYQWYGSSDGEDFEEITGETDDTYDAPTGTTGWMYYYVIVTNTIIDNGDGGIKSATVKSDTIALRVNDVAAVDADVPVITQQPVGGSVNLGAVKVLTVEVSVTDGGTLTYQWYGVSGAPIAGATGSSYAVPTWSSYTQIDYYVEVTNTIDDNDDGGIKSRTVVSDTVRVIVSGTPATHAQQPNVTVSPDGGSVLRDGDHTLHVAASVTDGGTLTYQWYRNTSATDVGATAIVGATGTSYTVPTDVNGTTYYFVVVTNTNTSVDGNTVATATTKAAMIKVSDVLGNDDNGGLPIALIAGAAIAAIVVIAAVAYFLFIRKP